MRKRSKGQTTVPAAACIRSSAKSHREDTPDSIPERPARPEAAQTSPNACRHGRPWMLPNARASSSPELGKDTGVYFS
ncbi:hypothetical protein BC567DRAFT_217612 [Phyllosticta citribraziliensis]